MQSSQDFYSLTPDRVLDAVESYGYRCTGRTLALNSLENRVYEVEVEGENRFLVAKFYRPGRWTREQIQEEHEYLGELFESELPVVAPIKDSGGETIYTSNVINCFGALFPKRSGRMEAESSLEELERLGRLLARVHQIGARKPFLHRRNVSTEWYLHYNREAVAEFLPESLEDRYEKVLDIFSSKWESLPKFPTIRLHGDCHRGNILWRPDEGPLLVDFDDALQGPMVQDLWLLFPGRISEYRDEIDSIIRGYEMFQEFDDRQLKAIELLRSFRMVQYAGWIARRWEDPSFKGAFPHFIEETFWARHVADLEDQAEACRLIV